MKKLYYTILFLFISTLSNAQADYGTPIGDVLPIARVTKNPEKKAVVAEMNINSTASNRTAGTPTGFSDQVGITEGQLTVSLSGAANYSIPIEVPPGINGVAPQISIAYSSLAGNGLAGIGWNITGISAITRIPSTKFHDNTIDGVDFNSLDRFAFDGQRLVVKKGTTGLYGADGTVYETESFSKRTRRWNATTRGG